MGFGALRVLNDDTVAPGKGFGMHPHHNMEIVTLPLAGSLQHTDSVGNQSIIRAGDVQIMSAGSGIRHAELNASQTEVVQFLQIWIIPKWMDTPPTYQQMTYTNSKKQNHWQVIVGPNQPGAVHINQDAWFSLLEADAHQSFDYQMFNTNHGVYFFVIEGQAQVAGHTLHRRYGLGCYGAPHFSVYTKHQSFLLAIEVPLLR